MASTLTVEHLEKKLQAPPVNHIPIWIDYIDPLSTKVQTSPNKPMRIFYFALHLNLNEHLK